MTKINKNVLYGKFKIVDVDDVEAIEHDGFYYDITDVEDELRIVYREKCKEENIICDMFELDRWLKENPECVYQILDNVLPIGEVKKMKKIDTKVRKHALKKGLDEMSWYGIQGGLDFLSDNLNRIINDIDEHVDVTGVDKVRNCLIDCQNALDEAQSYLQDIDYDEDIEKSKTKKVDKTKTNKARMIKYQHTGDFWTDANDAVAEVVVDYFGPVDDLPGLMFNRDFENYIGNLEDDIEKSKSKKGETMKATESKLTKSKGIKLKGYNGTWKVVKSKGLYSLLESEQMGNKALNVILKGKKIIKEADAENDEKTKEFFELDKAEDDSDVIDDEKEEKCGSKAFKAEDVDDKEPEQDEVKKRRIMRSHASKSKSRKSKISKEGEEGLPAPELDPIVVPNTDKEINNEGPVVNEDDKPAMNPEEVPESNETALPEEMLNHEELEEVNSTEDVQGKTILDLDPAETINKMRMGKFNRTEELGEQSTPVSPSGYPYARIGEGKLSNKLKKPTGQVRKF